MRKILKALENLSRHMTWASFRVISILLISLMAIPINVSAENDLVMEFLMVGDVQGWPNNLGDAQPAIDINLVPCRSFFLDYSDEDLQRLSRVYFPRNMEVLNEYEVLFFNHPRLNFLTLNQQLMMVEFAGTKNKASIAYPLSHYEEVQDPWLNSPISEAFPVDVEKFASASRQGLPDEFGGYTGLRLDVRDPPVFANFEPSGIYDSKIYQWSRPAFAKEGAKIWVSMIDGPPALPEAPAFLSWPYEDSETWAFGIHPNRMGFHWAQAGEWWELQFLIICYYSSGRDIPKFDQILNMKRVRSQFIHFREVESMFQGVVNFVSKVGANTMESEEILLEAQILRSEAELDYLEGAYQSADNTVEEALDMVNLAMDEAMEAKDRALTWIYISEWLATFAVAMLSGFIVWELMVRRILYRRVKTTKLR